MSRELKDEPRIVDENDIAAADQDDYNDDDIKATRSKKSKSDRKSSKRSSKKRSKKKRSRTLVKTEGQHDGQHDHDGQEQEYTLEEYTNPTATPVIDEYIDPSLPYSVRFAKRQMIERNKRKRTRGGADTSTEQNRITIQTFIGRMLYAASQDRERLKAGRPAFEKQNMINDVSKQLLRTDIIDDLLETHLLGAIRQWLLPSPDGRLVNLRIRSTLYPLLLKLPVAQEQLRKSQLGQLLVLLAQHPDETLENRKLLVEIIHKWVRKMTGADVTYFSRGPKGNFSQDTTALSQEDGGDGRETSKSQSRPNVIEGKLKDVKRSTISRASSKLSGNLRLNSHRYG